MPVLHRKRNRLGQRGSELGQPMWYCKGTLMTEMDKNAFLSNLTPMDNYLNAQNPFCRPAFDAAPSAAAAPASSAGPVNVTQTVIQTPTQNQASDQGTDIGSSRPSTVGAGDDVLTAFLDLWGKTMTPAAAPTVTVSATSEPGTVVTGPSGFDLGNLAAWASENKKALIFGGAALLAFLYWRSLPSQRKTRK